MKAFMDKDFLLETPTAQHLYHDYSAKLPIVDYHMQYFLLFRILSSFCLLTYWTIICSSFINHYFFYLMS